MTKSEVVEAFKARGEFAKHSHTYDDVWSHAFRLFTASTREVVNQRCGSCFSKVLKWLQS